MADVSDYDEAVRRIVDAEVDPGSTSKFDVKRDLSGAASPQLTPKVADGVADAVLTEDRVAAAIESSGELPTAREIEAFAGAADPYDMGGRQEVVAREVADSVATVDDVRVSIASERESAESRGRPMFREDVEDAVDDVAGSKRFLGSEPGEVADREAKRFGAPSESNYRRAAAQTVARGDSVAPSEVSDTERTTPVSVIRDEGGEAVAVTGGSRAEDREAVADAVGGSVMSQQEVVDSMDVEGSGDRADLTLRGRKVGEVDL